MAGGKSTRVFRLSMRISDLYQALRHVRVENVGHPGVSDSVVLHDSPMGPSMELASIQEGVRRQTV